MFRESIALFRLLSIAQISVKTFFYDFTTHIFTVQDIDTAFGIFLMYFQIGKDEQFMTTFAIFPFYFFEYFRYFAKSKTFSVGSMFQSRTTNTHSGMEKGSIRCLKPSK